MFIWQHFFNSSDIKISKSRILELSHLFHIQTPIKGSLKNNIHILELLYNLYPTPAVAGYPVKNTIDETTAAVMMETVQREGGVRPVQLKLLD